MAPPSAIHTHETIDTGASVPSNGHELGTATHEPGLTKAQAEKADVAMPSFPTTKKFADKYEEREYQKGRLALAFRIFAKFGFDEGVAGHITLRVSCVLDLGEEWEIGGTKYKVGPNGDRLQQALVKRKRPKYKMVRVHFYGLLCSLMVSSSPLTPTIPTRML